VENASTLCGSNWASSNLKHFFPTQVAPLQQQVASSPPEASLSIWSISDETVSFLFAVASEVEALPVANEGVTEREKVDGDGDTDSCTIESHEVLSGTSSISGIFGAPSFWSLRRKET
jgi:hypothetical protein